MQEMNYEGGYHDEPPVPQYNTYTGGPAGQKLSGFAPSKVARNGFSSGQRLALAIVSLILWLFFFMSIAFAVVAIGYSDISILLRELIVLMLGFGMLLFTGLVIFINVLFNRSKR